MVYCKIKKHYQIIKQRFIKQRAVDLYLAIHNKTTHSGKSSQTVL